MIYDFCEWPRHAEQEMVAAERIFQYLQLGASGGGSAGGRSCTGEGSAGGGSSSSTAEKRRKLPPTQPGSATKPASSSSTAGPGTAACDVEEQRQPLLLPLQSAATLDTGMSGNSRSNSSWIHSGHVRFENVWLRYTPWKEGSVNRSTGAREAASTPVGEAEEGSAAGSLSPFVLHGVSLDIEPGKRAGLTIPDGVCCQTACCVNPPASSPAHASAPCLCAAICLRLLCPSRPCHALYCFTHPPPPSNLALPCIFTACRQPRGHLRPHRRRQEQPAGGTAALGPHLWWTYLC